MSLACGGYVDFLLNLTLVSMEQDKTALLFLFFPAALMILRSFYWDGCLPAFPVQLYEVFILSVLPFLTDDFLINVFFFLFLNQIRLGSCSSMLGWLCERTY